MKRILTNRSLFPILILGWISLGLISLAGGAIILFGTRLGPGIGGDATTYIVSARNLAAGRGLGLYGPEGNFTLMPYFPPMFSLFLSFFTVLGLDTVAAARWLNAACFSLTIFMGGCSVAVFSRRAWLGWLAALLLAGSNSLVIVYTWAMSEPLFLACSFSSLFFLLLYFQEYKRGYLAAAGLLLGIASVTRYLGFPIIAAGGAAILLFGNPTWRKRWLDLLLFGLLAGLPAAAWIAIDILATGTVGTRSWQFTDLLPRTRLFFSLATDVLWSWLPFSATVQAKTPYSVYRILKLIPPAVFLVFLAGFLAAARRKLGRPWKQYPAARLTAVLLLVCVSLLGFLYATFLFVRPDANPDNRIMLPIHIAIILTLASLGGLALQTWPRAVWMIVLTIIGAFLLTFSSYANRTRLLALEYNHNGTGFLGAYWREATVIAAVRQLPADVPIITNEPAAILFLTGRPFYYIMELGRTRPLAEEQFAPYGSDLSEKGQAAFVQRGGALVLFGSLNNDLKALYGSQAPARETAFTRGLYLSFQGNHNDRIYFYQKPAGAGQ